MASLSAQEVRERAVKLQDDFLRAHSGNANMDPRDISRVQNSVTFVEKFIRHNRGDHSKAFEHMIESLLWRKSFGVNDIQYDDISEDLWKSGMAMNHGYDVSGHNVVILQISKHRKDSKRGEMIRKWIAFCYEMHQKVYPNNKMCMVFDMTGAGLSNMDMDLVRFVVNCFKIYFPDLLQWLLVYNMPWVLQAAWKIVQSWLSEGAAAKVKFVTTDNIQEYIPAHNLPIKYGGTDPWEFVYEVEREVMLRQIREVEDESQSRAGSETGDEDVKELPEDDEVEESMVSYDQSNGASYNAEWDQEETPESASSTKQVRFSTNIPPSRQSRYGTEEEASINSLRSSAEQSMLKKGTASSSGFRRRQVTRLMNSQENPREKEGGGRERERNGVISSLDRSTDPPGVMATIGDILVSPANELVFTGKKNTDVYCNLTLKNISSRTVAYKIKTTAPLRYKVRPNLALIAPRAVTKVQVMLIQGAEPKGSTQEKFLVQTHTFPDQNSVPQPSDLTLYWKALPASAIKEHRMKCRWVSAEAAPSKPGPKDSHRSTPPNSPRANSTRTNSPRSSLKTSSDSSSVSRRPAIAPETIEQKVQKLAASNAELKKALAHLQLLNYGIISILLLLLITVIIF